MAGGRRAGEVCTVRVLIPGTGGALRVTAVPTGRALSKALLAQHRLSGRVIRRGGSWVFRADPAPVPNQAGRVLLSHEQYDALAEQDQSWLGAVLPQVRQRWTASGWWVESADAVLLRELRTRARAALG